MVNGQFQGPVPPGFSEETFRKTGRLVREFQGPLPPGATPEEIEKFRQEGVTPERLGGRGFSPEFQAQLEADRQREAQAKAQAQQQFALLKQRQAEFEAQQIQEKRQQIIARGGSERTQTSISREGKAVETTTIQGQGRERVFIRKVNGKTTLKSFDVQGRRTGGVTITERREEAEAPPVEITPTPPEAAEPTFLERLVTFGAVGFPGGRFLFKSERETAAGQIRKIKEEGLMRAITGRGGVGEEFVGVAGVPGKPILTFRELEKVSREKAGLPGKVVAELIPTTPIEIALLGLTIGVFPILPKGIQIPTGAVITTLETKRAFDPGLAPEQRIAAGIVAAAVGTGTLFETLPFIKGQLGRLSGKFRPVKTQAEGFKAITGKTAGERIGLILEKAPLKKGLTKDVKLPITSPLKRGGFGVRPGEKRLFLGGPQPVATSQISFFKPGKKIRLEREFFVTPAEPTLKIPETRISRLGLADLFKFRRKDIAFGIPKTAQIGIERAAIVTRVGRGEAFAIGRGTELEAIKGPGAVITAIKQIGITAIKGQRVDIFEFISGKGGAVARAIRQTTGPTGRVSAELLLGLGLSTKAITPTAAIPPTAPAVETITISKAITKFITPTTAPTKRGRRITTPTITPSIKAIPPVAPTITKTLTSITLTSITLARLPPSKAAPGRFLPSIPTLPPEESITRSFRRRRREAIRTGGILDPIPGIPRGKFLLEIRRFGKFKPVGIFRTPEKAFEIGVEKAAKTLAATLKVTKVSGFPPLRLKTPRGFRRKVTPTGILFIERKELRLSRLQERKEIQAARLSKLTSGLGGGGRKGKKKKKLRIFDLI